MRKFLHNLLKGASLTTALFIFQACYGIRQPFWEYGEAPMRFTLVSGQTGDPLTGIRILSAVSTYNGSIELGVTDEAGHCQVDIPYLRNEKVPFLHFEDPEGRMAPKDTLLADLREREILIQMIPQP